MSMQKRLSAHVEGLTEEEKTKLIFNDPLTDLMNRRAFEFNTFSSVAIIDIDSLKYVNDTYGHRAGDHFIYYMGRVLLECMKELNADVYRFGGDEFVIACNDELLMTQCLAVAQCNVGKFSYGVGFSLEQADAKLSEQKDARLKLGMRTSREKEPTWADDLMRLVASAS